MSVKVVCLIGNRISPEVHLVFNFGGKWQAHRTCVYFTLYFSRTYKSGVILVFLFFFLNYKTWKILSRNIYTANRTKRQINVCVCVHILHIYIQRVWWVNCHHFKLLISCIHFICFRFCLLRSKLKLIEPFL